LMYRESLTIGVFQILAWRRCARERAWHRSK
jgi:hypothetical protein